MLSERGSSVPIDPVPVVRGDARREMLSAVGGRDGSGRRPPAARSLS